MILKTIDNRTKKEVFRELGTAFNVILGKEATDHFQEMLSDIFGENLAQSEGVFAIIESHSPGIENICLYDEDWHFIYTKEGELFSQLAAPERK